MAAYSIVAIIHVIVAVVGLGQISVLALLARRPELASTTLFRKIFQAVGISLILMLVTGVLLLWLSNWTYVSTGWMGFSFVLFLLLGALHGIGQSTVKKIAASGGSFVASPLIGKLRKVTLAMSLTLAVLVLLMEGKPF